MLVMVNTRKKFVAAGPLENDIRKPRCSPEVAKPLGTRLWTQQILDQVISKESSTEENQRAPDPGLKLLEPSWKQAIHPIRTQTLKLQATSFKPQAASIKLQAASDKLPDSMSFIKFQAASIKGLD